MNLSIKHIILMINHNSSKIQSTPHIYLNQTNFLFNSMNIFYSIYHLLNHIKSPNIDRTYQRKNIYCILPYSRNTSSYLNIILLYKFPHTLENDLSYNQHCKKCIAHYFHKFCNFLYNQNILLNYFNIIHMGRFYYIFFQIFQTLHHTACKLSHYHILHNPLYIQYKFYFLYNILFSIL